MTRPYSIAFKQKIIERLMRAILIVVVDEVVEAGLLHEEVLSGGFGGFFFEREMHM